MSVGFKRPKRGKTRSLQNGIKHELERRGYSSPKLSKHNEFNPLREYPRPKRVPQ
jgi:hypothetical protein